MNTQMKTIRAAVRRLDPEAVTQCQPTSLEAHEIDALVALADQVAAKAILQCAARIGKAKPERIARIAADHSLTMMNFLSVRASLHGKIQADEDDDCGEIEFY